jgi:hypothetical protein
MLSRYKELERNDIGCSTDLISTVLTKSRHLAVQFGPFKEITPKLVYIFLEAWNSVIGAVDPCRKCHVGSGNRPCSKVLKPERRLLFQGKDYLPVQVTGARS